MHLYYCTALNDVVRKFCVFVIASAGKSNLGQLTPELRANEATYEQNSWHISGALLIHFFTTAPEPPLPGTDFR